MAQRPKSATITRHTRRGKSREGPPLKTNPLLEANPEEFARQFQEGLERVAGPYFKQFDCGVVIDRCERCERIHSMKHS